MTKPDEALLWAREQSVGFWEQSGAAPKDVAYHVAASRSGEYDADLENIAHDRREWLDGYRAGAAALEARIKALEEALRELIEYPDDMLPTRLWDNARALLKEADQ